MAKTYKETHSLEERQEKADRVLRKYPDRVPLIVEPSAKSSIGAMPNPRLLVPRDVTVAQLIYRIRNSVQLRPDQSIFLFINNILPPTSKTVGQIYEEQKDPEDLLLYVTYSGESAFGN